MSNRTLRRDRRQAEEYQKVVLELAKTKQNYEDLRHQCAEAEDLVHRLTIENSKVTDLVRDLSDRLQFESQEHTKVKLELVRLRGSIAALSQTADASTHQTRNELSHEIVDEIAGEHLCFPSAEDPGVCTCGKLLPVLDLSKFVSPS